MSSDNNNNKISKEEKRARLKEEMEIVQRFMLVFQEKLDLIRRSSFGDDFKLEDGERARLLEINSLGNF